MNNCNDYERIKKRIEEAKVENVGAKFIRTDSTGTIVGNEITTNNNGNAVFNNVPFSESGSTANIISKYPVMEVTHLTIVLNQSL